MPAYVVMWVHLIAVIAWIGGLLFFPFVLEPALAGLTPDSQRAEVLRRAGRRVRTIAWTAIVALIVTGAINMLNAGVVTRIESAWGAVLMLKLVLVAIAVGLALVHDFILDPYASVLPRGGAASAPPANAARWMERAILILSLLILLVAAYLARI